MEPGQHIFISGRTGSGKSTLTRQVSAYFPRLVIFDRKGEWRNEPDATFVHSVHEFEAAYRRLFNEASFRIVVLFPRGTPDHDLIEASERILHRLFAAEPFSRQGLGVVFEEIWLYSSPYFLGAWLGEVVLTGREEKISLIANAQRPALVHKNITSQCDHIFVGQFHDPNDGKYFKDVLGDVPELRQILPKYQFVWFRPGEKPISITT